MDEDIKNRWNGAYQAKPMVYKKPDGTLFAGFALTEDTDSLFPLHPEKQWAVSGKIISEWNISFVTLPDKKDPDGKVVGMVEYHRAMERLEQYFIASGDDYRLIRALTKAELISVAAGDTGSSEKRRLFGLFKKK